MAHLAKQGDPVRAFFIYSRKDKEIRDALESHLGGLKRSGRIKCFHDGELVAGQDWEPAILDELEKAQLILLLVSADSLDSPYCDKELSRALERHAAGEALVIPVLVRHVDWKEAPFAHIQILPRSQHPIAKAKDLDEALSEIAAEIRKTLDAFSQAPRSPASKRPASQHPTSKSPASKTPTSVAPGSEAREVLRQALESAGSWDANKVARKFKLIDESEQQWLLGELVVRRARGEKALSAITVFGAACELYPPEQIAKPLNQLLRHVTIQEDVSLKAVLLDSIPPDTLRTADPDLLHGFFDDVIDIVLGDHFEYVNVITAPLVEAQEAIPEELHRNYVEALLSQAESRSYQGAPAARHGLQNLPEAIALAGFFLLDADYLCTSGSWESVREFVQQYKKLAPPEKKALIRDYLSMDFREFRDAYAEE